MRPSKEDTRPEHIFYPSSPSLFACFEGISSAFIKLKESLKFKEQEEIAKQANSD